MIGEMHKWVDALFSRIGLGGDAVRFFKGAVFILALLLLCAAVTLLLKRVLLLFVRRAVSKTATRWDDVLLEKRFFHRLANLAPVLVIHLAAPSLLEGFPGMVRVVFTAGNIYATLVILSAFHAFLDFAGTIYGSYGIAKVRPIKGYLQIGKILAGITSVIFVLSFVLDKSPTYLVTGLGALTAILVLVFRDSILGFVAGVQVSANNLVRIGDWIEMPKYGADGDVIDIGLHTVLIRNFDRTVTTVPTYALVSDSFKNWRGMFEGGGRRIKRDVHVDINSIRPCDAAMLARFSRIPLLSDYIKEKTIEIEAYNREHHLDPSIPAAGRRMTNIGVFRAYVTRFLRQHPKIHRELMCMVRQLQPGEKGLPLQIYAFTTDTNWASYEEIQADIFDHILSVIPFFGLRVFQYPSGSGVVSSLDDAERD